MKRKKIKLKFSLSFRKKIKLKKNKPCKNYKHPIKNQCNKNQGAVAKDQSYFCKVKRLRNYKLTLKK